MLNQPMSSPMMKTMFGFLPAAGCCSLAVALVRLRLAWATSSPFSTPSQHGAAGAGAGEESTGLLLAFVGLAEEASAGRLSRKLPDAATYPSGAAAARKTTVWNLVFRYIGPPTLKKRRRCSQATPLFRKRMLRSVPVLVPHRGVTRTIAYAIHARPPLFSSEDW